MNNQYEQKPGEGVVFANQSENPNAPTMKGTITLPADAKPGQKMDIAFWRKTSKAGKEYYSLKIEQSREKM